MLWSTQPETCSQTTRQRGLHTAPTRTPGLTFIFCSFYSLVLGSSLKGVGHFLRQPRTNNHHHSPSIQHKLLQTHSQPDRAQHHPRDPLGYWNAHRSALAVPTTPLPSLCFGVNKQPIHALWPPTSDGRAPTHQCPPEVRDRSLAPRQPASTRLSSFNHSHSSREPRFMRNRPNTAPRSPASRSNQHFSRPRSM